MSLHVPDALTTDVVAWARYYYGHKLVGIIFYDPRAASQSYPCAEINLLIVLTDAPASARDRYDESLSLVIEVVMGGGFQVMCRIQTLEELNALMELQLPLLNIYMQDSQIVLDSGQALSGLKASLLPST